jgi:hypothetical protein
MLVPGTLVGAASLASFSGQGTHAEVERITRKGHAIERRASGQTSAKENLANSTSTRLMLKWSGLLPSVGLAAPARRLPAQARSVLRRARRVIKRKKRTARQNNVKYKLNQCQRPLVGAALRLSPWQATGAPPRSAGADGRGT